MSYFDDVAAEAALEFAEYLDIRDPDDVRDREKESRYIFQDWWLEGRVWDYDLGDLLSEALTRPQFDFNWPEHSGTLRELVAITVTELMAYEVIQRLGGSGPRRSHEM